MKEVKALVEYHGEDHVAWLGTITHTTLGREDHGIWTFAMTVAGGSNGIAIGHRTLDTPVFEVDAGSRDGKKWVGREGTAYGMQLIIDTVDAVGASSWEKLVGQRIFVVSEAKASMGTGLGMTAIGFVSEDQKRSLFFSDHLEEWKANHPDAVPGEIVRQPL